jgi:hypothetical protein
VRARIRRQGGTEQSIGQAREFAVFATDGRIAAFAARVLADNDMSPRCLANLLQRLEDSGKEAAGAGGRQSANVYPASHPANRGTHRCAGGPAYDQGILAAWERRLSGRTSGRDDGTPGFALPSYFAENGVIL